MFKRFANIFMMVLALSVAPAVAQEQAPAVDTGGKVPVLCLMHMLVATKASAEICKWSRMPADDVIDKGLADIAAFAVVNSSHPVTLEQSNDHVKRELKVYRDAYSQESAYCTANPKDSDSEAALPWVFHTMDPARLRALIADTLSVPREPRLNPCL
jgi:hypothetical protein